MFDGGIGVNLDAAYLSGVLQQLAESAAGNVELVRLSPVPVVNKVSAGYPTDFTDLSYPRGVADAAVGCPDVGDPDAFAARVHGDSMRPKYTQGDIVIFSPAADPRSGDDCFVRFEDGQTTFKRVYFETAPDGHERLRLSPATINTARKPSTAKPSMACTALSFATNRSKPIEIVIAATDPLLRPRPPVRISSRLPFSETAMADLVPVKRALLSVSDKTGLVAFATTLQKTYGTTLLSTGGTAKALRDAGLAVTDVSEVTGFPEMMDGRVKTLHPKIHGGLLAVRDDPAHAAAMAEHGIEPIDLVVINLYPFEQTVAKPGVTFEEAIENIDIGGPSMVRSAAKNHAYVAVVTSPDQYVKVLGDLEKHSGSTCGKHRRKLAQKAFERTCQYDRAISSYFQHVVERNGELLEGQFQQTPSKATTNFLRYGENPHQFALIVPNDAQGTASVAHARQLHGKALSYINVLDADAALACVKDFDQPAACIVKHATPCGVGTGESIDVAVERAYASDPVAAFGGIVATNQPMTVAAANALTAGQKFLEVIVAPSFEAIALETLRHRWKNVRLLEVGPMFVDEAARRFHRGQAGTHGSPATSTVSTGTGPETPMQVRSIVGGELHQAADVIGIVESEWKNVGKRAPTGAELADIRVGWIACKHVKSNAIVICKNEATVGIGGGQVDRVGAARIAIEKAGERAKGAVAASDAFFPFPDGPKLLIDAGVTAIVQPGGSVRDVETIALCDQRGVALIFTGRRHFRH